MKFDVFAGASKLLLVLLCLSFAYAPKSAAADTPPPTYDSCLEDMMESMISPMIDVMTRAGKKKLSVAVIGYRERSSGERSPFCKRLEADLSKKIHTDTVFGQPDPLEIKQALDALQGSKTDLNDPATLSKLGDLLHVDVILSGNYEVLGSNIALQSHLYHSNDSVEVWSNTEYIPSNAMQGSENTLDPDSAIPHYVAAAAAPPKERPSEVPAFPDDTSPSSGVSAAAPTTLSLNSEDSFSWERVNFELGYMHMEPRNPTFESVTGVIRGVYADIGWADVLTAQLDFWNIPSIQLQDASSLLAYAIGIMATFPYRWGPYVVLYAGLSARFESINVGGTTLPAGDPLTYGNNNLGPIGGIKVHDGPWGVDFNGSWDFDSNINVSGYTIFKLGLYYELNLI
jgi:hypothetical protein